MDLTQKLKQGTLSRRDFLKLSASFGLSTLGALYLGCSKKNHKHPTNTGTGTGTGTGVIPEKYTVTGKISDIDTENPLEALIKLKQNDFLISQQNCLSDGTYHIQNLEQGIYDVEILCLGFNTYKAGKLVVSEEKQSQAKLENDFKLITDDIGFNTFFNEVCRNAQPYTQRWIPHSDGSPITVYIVTKNTRDNSDIPIEAQNVIVDLFTNYIPRFTDGVLNNFKFEYVETLQYKPGTIEVCWDKNLSGAYGLHGENDGYGDDSVKQLNYGYIKIKGPPPLGIEHKVDITYLHESAQVCGARRDSNYNVSVFNDPIEQSLVDYMAIDLLLGKYLYSRPPGNISPDNNPEDYVINE